MASGPPGGQLAFEISRHFQSAIKAHAEVLWVLAVSCLAPAQVSCCCGGDAKATCWHDIQAMLHTLLQMSQQLVMSGASAAGAAGIVGGCNAMLMALIVSAAVTPMQ